jgi:hypothetical protein
MRMRQGDAPFDSLAGSRRRAAAPPLRGRGPMPHSARANLAAKTCGASC